MSAPAIYIAVLGKTPHVPSRYTRSDSQLSGPIVLGISWRGIPELPYAIRNSEFGNRNSEPGYRKSSWCGIFPLDADGYGAVGCAHRRMVRWCNNEQL